MDEDSNEYILSDEEVEKKDTYDQMHPTSPCLFCSTKVQTQGLCALFFL